jgi:hypothetical protein
MAGCSGGSSTRSGTSGRSAHRPACGRRSEPATAVLAPDRSQRPPTIAACGATSAERVTRTRRSGAGAVLGHGPAPITPGRRPRPRATRRPPARPHPARAAGAHHDAGADPRSPSIRASSSANTITAHDPSKTLTLTSSQSQASERPSLSRCRAGGSMAYDYGRATRLTRETPIQTPRCSERPRSVTRGGLSGWR